MRSRIFCSYHGPQWPHFAGVENEQPPQYRMTPRALNREQFVACEDTCHLQSNSHLYPCNPERQHCEHYRAAVGTRALFALEPSCRHEWRDAVAAPSHYPLYYMVVTDCADARWRYRGSRKLVPGLFRKRRIPDLSWRARLIVSSACSMVK